MNDDFLNLLREQPSREFADALYRRISQENNVIAFPYGKSWVWSLVKPLAVGVGVGLVLIILLLGFSPGMRTAAAQNLQRILAAAFARPDGSINLAPAPPFAVKQPRNLAQGLQLTASQYAPGNGIAVNDQASKLPRLPQGAGPVAQQALKRDWGKAAHLVLVYESPGGLYLLIVERKAKPNEPLPAGEKRTIANQSASLQRIDQGLALTWVDEGTWIHVESNIAENDVLGLAASFVTTAAAVSADEQYAPISPDTSVQPRELPMCDSRQQRPKSLILGEVTGQNRKGSVWVELLDRPIYPETVAYGSNVPDRREVLQIALGALRDSTLPWQKLPYSSISSFRKNDGEECMRPDPQVQGYIVIEVWDHQVNIGYGGAGAEMKERAIKALEQQIEIQAR